MEFKVNGMSCGHCVKSITEALNDLGIQKVRVNLEKGKVSVEENKTVNVEQVKQKIEELGYEVE